MLVGAALVSAAAIGAFDTTLSPDVLSPQDGVMLALAVIAFGGIAGGWKAAQLAVGRGRPVSDIWTLTWLCLFAAWIALPWLRLAL